MPVPYSSEPGENPSSSLATPVIARGSDPWVVKWFRATQSREERPLLGRKGLTGARRRIHDDGVFRIAYSTS